MSHVNFKKWQCHVSLSLIVPSVPYVECKKMSLYFDPSCRMSLSPMLHVEFKKSSCRPVDFRGQRPCSRAVVVGARGREYRAGGGGSVSGTLSDK